MEEGFFKPWGVSTAPAPAPVRRPYHARLTTAEKRDIWEMWLSGVNYKVIMDKYDIKEACIWTSMKKYRKHYGVPKGVGYKKAQAIVNRYELRQLDKLKPQPQRTVEGLEWIPAKGEVRKVQLPVTHEEHDHMLSLSYNRDNDFVFCRDCGQRWIKE